jgi:hypothetical protein
VLTRSHVLKLIARRMSALLLVAGATLLRAQLPLDQIPVHYHAALLEITRKPDFAFETSTPPTKVRFRTMEQLFEHPRLAAAMWRYCQFVPEFYAFERPPQQLTIDDGKGLHGNLTLVHQRPGFRVYLVDGRVETGRMKNPFPVGAKMVTVYRYWEDDKGFQSHIQTWTKLDSALLGLVSKPFRGYIRRRQEEFIAYIMYCMSIGGTFAELHPDEFRDPIRREGDPIAIRQFEDVFGRKKKPRNGN